ncbi:MAG: DNA repair protein RecN [Alphaproteobacteria bacterium MarineAlpha2_Bin1]|nr:MAG: DNA repair protein RecN [Alphaproteobacteria bacterium MarineAlpha2_Bin1]
MLETLSIRNIVLVEKLDVDFEKGLCVLTGETGAGKSILLDALGLALGNRADLSLIRTNTSKGTVSATFNIRNNQEVIEILQNNDIDVENSVNLKRTLSIDGKSKAYCNDIPVSVSYLKKVGDRIAELQSQRSENDLFSINTQMILLDRFAQNFEIKNKLKDVFIEKSNLYSNLDKLEKKFFELDANENFKAEAINEIKRFNTFVGEEQKLVQERAIMKNLDKIESILNNAIELVAGPQGINSNISKLDRVMTRSFEEFKGKLDESFLSQIEKFLLEGNEIEHTLRDLIDAIGSDSNNIEEVEDRLFSLRALARKYNCKCDELNKIQENFSMQINKQEDIKKEISKLKVKIEICEKNYSIISNELSRKRKNAAKQLEVEIGKEFAPLKLENTVFKISIKDKVKSDWNSDGCDYIIFEVSTNKGVPFLPLSQIASGGEMSRIMLALQVILKRKNLSKAIIFDEVDSGIGGSTADAVGERLSRLSKDFQVIAITHSPQVAAKGSYHLKIEKQSLNNYTFTNIKEISDAERQEEIARMLSGKNITVEARAAAANLLNVSSNEH